MENQVLMIAYHFPPIKGCSRIQRTLKFCQYFPKFGWTPVVLTANSRAYENTSQEQMRDISKDTLVKRAFALDTARHLSIKGRYFRLLASPDRWASWFIGGLVAGILIIRKTRPKLIWSTYPIATAHLIAFTLHRLTGIPWVADMRDPMAQEDYPTDPIQKKIFKWIEKKIASHAEAICYTSPSAINAFQSKYQGLVKPEQLHLIENGYDEECFRKAEKLSMQKPRLKNKPLLLLHSGVIYPSERDPRPFLQAVSRLKREAIISNDGLKIIFRASGHDDYLRPLLKSFNVDDIIHLAPPLPYIEALAEMLMVNGLLLFQSANCNSQIPAKVYEYLRSGRPILGITDFSRDTARLLAKHANNILTDISSSDDIQRLLQEFIGRIMSPAFTSPPPALQIYARREKLGNSPGFSPVC